MVQQLLSKFWFSKIIALVSRSPSLRPWLKFRTPGLEKTRVWFRNFEKPADVSKLQRTPTQMKKTQVPLVLMANYAIYVSSWGVKLAAGTVRAGRGQRLLQRWEQGGGSSQHKSEKMDVKQKLKFSNLEYDMLRTFYWEEFWKLSSVSVMTVFVWFIYCQQTHPTQ